VLGLEGDAMKNRAVRADIADLSIERAYHLARRAT
jgi:hypothetical protein